MQKWTLKEVFDTTVMAAVIGVVLTTVAYWQDIVVKVTDALMKLY